MNPFSYISVCSTLCLAVLVAGCDSRSTNQWAVNSIKTKNTELTLQLKEMKATIDKAQSLNQNAEQLQAKHQGAIDEYNRTVEQLMTAIDRNIQLNSEYSTLALREQELKDRLKRLEDTFQQIQDEVKP